MVAIVNLKIAMEHEVVDGNKWCAKIKDRGINDNRNLVVTLAYVLNFMTECLDFMPSTKITQKGSAS